MSSRDQTRRLAPGARPQLWAGPVRRWMPLVLFVGGVILTIVVVGQLIDDERKLEAERQDRVINNLGLSVEQTMADYVDTLRGVKGLHEARNALSAQEFETFVDSTHVFDRLSGIQGVGWNRLISQDNVAAYEQFIVAGHALATEDFEVFPSGDASEHLVVEFLSPWEGNEGAFGFDILSEPRRAAAFEQARRSGGPVATAPVVLVQDDEEVPGILVLIPTVAADATTPRVDGAAVAVFRTADLLGSLAASVDTDFQVEDVSIDDAGVERRVVLYEPEGEELPPRAAVDVDMYGRTWRVNLLGGQPGAAPLILPILSALSGVGVSAAIAGLLYVSNNTATRAEAKAKILTARLSQLNDELAVTTLRLTRGVEAADVGLWESNLSRRETWASSPLAELFVGLSGDVAARERLAAALHPDDRQAVMDWLPPTQGTVSAHEFRLAGSDLNDGADAQLRWFAVRLQVLFKGGEKVAIGAVIDVTDLHRQTEAVEMLNRQLVQSNQSLRDFSHVASHDLRSPLRAIDSLVSFLREDLGDGVGPEAEHHLSRIEDRVVRMGRLIDDLLVYASAYGRTAAVAETDLDAMVEDIVQTLDIPEGMVVERNVTRAVVTLAEAPFASCVRNLIDNGLKHHDRGQGRVDVDVHITGGTVVVRVTDDGPGIEAEYLDRVFEPFRRLTSYVTAPGSGIGLSVVQRSATAHGGTVEVASEFGVGSTFTLVWPIGDQLSDHKHSAAVISN